MKKLIGSLLLGMCLPVLSLAGIYNDIVPDTTTHRATMKHVGSIEVYASTQTSALSPSIVLQGNGGSITTRNGAAVSTMSSAGFSTPGDISAGDVLSAGDSIIACVEGATCKIHFPTNAGLGLGPNLIYGQTSVVNPLFIMGYNQIPGYSVNTTTQPGISWIIEPNYIDGTGHQKMEAYVQWIASTTIGSPDYVTLRPFFAQIDGDTHMPTTTLLSGGTLVSLNLNTGTGTADERQVGKAKVQLSRNTGEPEKAVLAISVDTVTISGEFAVLTSTLVVNVSGNVGIRTANPSASLEVNGFTKLGASTAPSFKMIELSTNTAANEGGHTKVAHGISSPKIRGMWAVVFYDANTPFMNNDSVAVGKNFDISADATYVYVENHATTSEFILDKPVKITVLYIE